MPENLGPVKGFSFDISSILLDTRDSKLALSFTQKVEALVSLLRKIDHPPVRQDADRASELFKISKVAFPMDEILIANQSLNKKHPSPSFETTSAV